MFFSEIRVLCIFVKFLNLNSVLLFFFQGVLDRFSQIQPKLIFSVAAVVYNGKTHDHMEKLISVVKGWFSYWRKTFTSKLCIYLYICMYACMHASKHVCMFTDSNYKSEFLRNLLALTMFED